MSDRPHSPADHPEELLAVFVDDSATPEERDVVQAHLATCRQCRDEAELATAARAALASLPELEPPGLALEGLPGLRRSRLIAAPLVPGGTARQGEEQPPIQKARRISWVPVLAAAAIVVIAGLLTAPILLRGGHSTGALSKGNAPRATESPLPVLVDVGASYTPASLNALAKRVASTTRQAELAPTPAPGATQPAFGSASGPGTVASGSADQAASRGALQCLVAGGGLEPDALPVYLEEATFQGVPAYIGAFSRTGARLNLVVVAVSRTGCQPLYTLSQSV